MPPATGWPVIVFNHGYIPPEQYRTTERYVAYVDGFARNGYIVLRPDYRGHGNSEGDADGLMKHRTTRSTCSTPSPASKPIPPPTPSGSACGGHSMGGSITLQIMVSTQDVKVGVIWAG
jgi:alpha-beta hydrolase superfamily lysophospholipase